MKRESFDQLEYETLRKEIEETKARLFRILTGGVIVIPAVQLLAQLEPGGIELGVLTLLLPFVVIAFMFLFLAENNGMMRAGSYIKDHIEKHIQKHSEDEIPPGWEHFLERRNGEDHRAHDRVIKISFLFLYCVYYTSSIYLVVNHFCNSEEYGAYAGKCLAWGFGVLLGVTGIGVTAYVIAKTKTRTS